MRKATDQILLTGPMYVASYEREHPQIVAGLKEIFIKFTRIGAKYDQAIEADLADDSVSEEERPKRIAKTKRETLSELVDAFEKNVTVLRQRADAEDAKLMRLGAIERPTDPVVLDAYLAQVVQIRFDLRDVGSIERSVVYRDTTDPVVLDAFESGGPVLFHPPVPPGAVVPPMPRFEPFVPPEQVQEAIRARGALKDPATAAEADTLRGLADVYAGEIGAMRAVVEEGLAPDPSSDSVALAAAGRTTS